MGLGQGQHSSKLGFFIMIALVITPNVVILNCEWMGLTTNDHVLSI